jgi:hypothetical protein
MDSEHFLWVGKPLLKKTIVKIIMTVAVSLILIPVMFVMIFLLAIFLVIMALIFVLLRLDQDILQDIFDLFSDLLTSIVPKPSGYIGESERHMLMLFLALFAIALILFFYPPIILFLSPILLYLYCLNKKGYTYYISDSVIRIEKSWIFGKYAKELSFNQIACTRIQQGFLAKRFECGSLEIIALTKKPVGTGRVKTQARRYALWDIPHPEKVEEIITNKTLEWQSFLTGPEKEELEKVRRRYAR